MILGLCGRAGSGKSSVAGYLVERYGATRIALADPLKDMARVLFSLTDEQVRGDAAVKERVDPRWGMSPRQILQRLGTECCRKHLGEDVWVRAMFARIEREEALARVRRAASYGGTALAFGHLWVVEDVRFLNEAEMIAAVGEVWRLHCSDSISTDAGAHPSEAEVDLIPAAHVRAELRSSRARGLEHLFGLIDQEMKRHR